MSLFEHLAKRTFEKATVNAYKIKINRNHRGAQIGTNNKKSQSKNQPIRSKIQITALITHAYFIAHRRFVVIHIKSQSFNSAKIMKIPEGNWSIRSKMQITTLITACLFYCTPAVCCNPHGFPSF